MWPTRLAAYPAPAAAAPPRRWATSDPRQRRAGRRRQCLPRHAFSSDHRRRRRHCNPARGDGDVPTVVSRRGRDRTPWTTTPRPVATVGWPRATTDIRAVMRVELRGGELLILRCLLPVIVFPPVAWPVLIGVSPGAADGPVETVCQFRASSVGRRQGTGSAEKRWDVYPQIRCSGTDKVAGHPAAGGSSSSTRRRSVRGAREWGRNGADDRVSGGSRRV